MIYCTSGNSTYSTRHRRHEHYFWTLGQNIKITSRYPFAKGDLVDLVNISDNSILIRPSTTKELTEEIRKDIRVILPLTNPVPVSAEDEYEFTSESCELLLVKDCKSRGNKKFIIVAAVPLGQQCKIHGMNQTDGRTKFELSVDIVEDSK
jgi:hypothetical protein